MTNRLPPAHYNPPPMFGLRTWWPRDGLPHYLWPSPVVLSGKTYITSDSFAPLYYQQWIDEPMPVDFSGIPYR